MSQDTDNSEYRRGYNTGYITAKRTFGDDIGDTQLKQIADTLTHRAEAIYKLIGGNDLVAPKPLASIGTANPPNPTSINEILEQLYHEAFYAGYRQDEITQKVVMPGATTAIRTLIASVRPAKYNNWSDVPDKAVGGLPSYTKKRAYQKAHNQALQDYDNAIKGVFDE